MTEVQKFKAALKKRFFKVSKDSCYSYLMLNPSAYRRSNGDLIVTGNIGVSIFGGSGTPDGELGCVSMQLHGKIKPYRCRNVHEGCSIIKHAFVATDAKHAIKEFDAWHETVKNARTQWKLII